ncbi:hypothetical protein [Streptomyces lancefieldiae]|uniref:Uncharacterized protein n=1 Tax=Streptomyces lancefieldiae TaxID=3075520 RepID=A0ABU3ATI3_9ACTN|nr:hypothetical protein [Streptomyces sp. DSM 40712]MDT0613496.1 hypothetical protein [Streptomyces sp. DSM 40712]
MTTTLRIAFTVPTAARAGRVARRPADVRVRDSRARVGDSAGRAAERRQHTRLTALTHAR